MTEGTRELIRLTREQLLHKARVQEEEVEIPNLGVVVLRHATKQETDRIRRDATVQRPDKTTYTDESIIQKRLVQACLVEPRLSAADVDLLWQGQEDVADQLVIAIFKMNRMGQFAPQAVTFRGDAGVDVPGVADGASGVPEPDGAAG